MSMIIKIRLSLHFSPEKGQWNGKMTFPEVNAALRTDQSFSQMLDENHNLGHYIQLGMVTQFPIDYMHLVCLGVMKRILIIWKKGPLQCRLGSRDIGKI